MGQGKVCGPKSLRGRWRTWDHRETKSIIGDQVTMMICLQDKEQIGVVLDQVQKGICGELGNPEGLEMQGSITNCCHVSFVADK